MTEEAMTGSKPGKLRMRPYLPKDAETVVRWLEDETRLRQWSADRYADFPITVADMNRYYDAERRKTEIFPMTVFDGSGLVGHLSMQFPDDHRDEVLFCSVVIDAAKRGRGYGKEMLCLALRFAFEIVGVHRAALNVFDNNPGARRCYEACGFRVVPERIPEPCFFFGERWTRVRMEIDREAFQAMERRDAEA